jgi:hypothetical protein
MTDVRVSVVLRLPLPVAMVTKILNACAEQFPDALLIPTRDPALVEIDLGIADAVADAIAPPEDETVRQECTRCGIVRLITVVGGRGVPVADYSTVETPCPDDRHAWTRAQYVTTD